MLGLLLPAHQDAPKAVHPTVAAFNNPAAGALTSLTRDLLGFFATCANVGRKAKLRQDRPHLVVVIAFVQTHALRLLCAGFGTRNHDAFDRGTQQFHVVPVGAVNRQPNRDAVALGQQAALDAALGAVGRIGAGLFPPRAALWSLPRPYSASSSQSLSAHRSVRRRLARASQTHQLRPIPESGPGRWTWRTTRSGSGPPTGNPFGTHKRSHRRRRDRAHAVAHRRSGGYLRAPAVAAPVRPRVHRRCGSPWWCGCLGCAHGRASQ